MGVEVNGRRVAEIRQGSKPVQMLYGGSQPVWPPQGELPGGRSELPVTEDALIFDADFANRGAGAYKNMLPTAQVHGIDYGLAADPAGSGRIVAWVDSGRGLTHGNIYPRASFEGPQMVRPSKAGATGATYNSVYAWHSQVLMPTSCRMTTGADWTLVMEVHGPPYIGASAAGLMVVVNPATGQHRLRMGDTEGLLTSNHEFPLGQWVGLTVICQYDYKSEGGVVEALINRTGNMASGWEHIKIGGVDRYPRDQISDIEGNAMREGGGYPASPRVGRYGAAKGRWYIAAHRVGRTVRGVHGPDWDGLVDGQPYTELVQSSTQRTT